MLVLSFANQESIYLDNLIQSFKKYNYKYQIIGKGTEWKNFITKIKHCQAYLEKMEYNDIVVVTDAFDVIACNSSDRLERKFRRFNKGLVFGCENICLDNCIPPTNYFRLNKKGVYNYANGGFYMGYRDNLVHLYKYVLKTKLTDDQVAIGKYINKYPTKVALDTQGELVSNIQINSYNHTIWKNNRVYNKVTKKYPCFIHTPSMFFDLGYRMDYFGYKVLKKEYQTICFTNKIEKLTILSKNHLGLTLNIIIGILVGIIILILLINYV